eukprot:365294-Chlamydomonas_euryale.AAC.7
MHCGFRRCIAALHQASHKGADHTYGLFAQINLGMIRYQASGRMGVFQSTSTTTGTGTGTTG